MMASALILGFMIALGLALTAGLLLWKQRREQSRLPYPPSISRTAAPGLNPLLHDETMASAAQSGVASAGGPDGVSRVSIVAGAPRQTHALQPGRPLLIGRKSRHGISLTNHRVSREHARLVLVGGAVQLTDLGSTNGTFVNEDKRRLSPHAPELLRPGQVFWIGPDVKLTVDAPQELASPNRQV
jgi:hypothetical protein